MRLVSTWYILRGKWELAPFPTARKMMRKGSGTQMGTSWVNECIFIITVIPGALSSLSGLSGIQRVWGRMDRWMINVLMVDGWMVDGWMNGWVDGWVDGWMDGWMDG